MVVVVVVVVAVVLLLLLLMMMMTTKTAPTTAKKRSSLTWVFACVGNDIPHSHQVLSLPESCEGKRHVDKFAMDLAGFKPDMFDRVNPMPCHCL
jgi:hypothetical protein